MRIIIKTRSTLDEKFTPVLKWAISVLDRRQLILGPNKFMKQLIKWGGAGWSLFLIVISYF